MQFAKRYGVSAVAGLAAAAVLVGCGSSGGGKSATNIFNGTNTAPSTSTRSDSSASAALAAAVDNTFAARNAKIHFEVKTVAGGQPLAIAGDGVLDLAQKKFQLTADLPASTGMSGQIEIRVIGNVLYIKLPAAATLATGGKAWIKVDSASSDKLGSFGALNQDPTQLLAALRSVSSDVKKVGTEDVRGVQTTHYRATIDLQKAAQANPDASEALDRYKSQLGGTELPADIWVDDQGYTRRFSVTITPAPGSDSAADGTSTVTVEMFDFGKADTSNVEPPPADEVGNFPANLGDVTG